MEHAMQLIDIVDERGKVVDHKLRHQVNKHTDLYHVIYIVLVSPAGGLILARIPHRSDLPNLFPGRLGATAATIRRHGETREVAARRAVASELGLDGSGAQFVGEGLFATSEDDRRSYVSVFSLVADMPEQYSTADIAELVETTPHELRHQLTQHPDEYTPNFIMLWERYQNKLSTKGKL